MKRILIPLLLAVCMAVSCGPSKHAVHVGMRYPSKSGIDLAGKIVSVVYLENDDDNATAFNGGLAEGFANALEQDYGTGEGSVGIYRMRVQNGGNYASRDSLFNLLIDTDADVVFVFDTLKLGTMTVSGATRVAAPASSETAYLSRGNMPFTMSLYCFDGMDETEEVHTFTGSSVARPDVYSNGNESSTEIIRRAFAALADEGFESGKVVAGSFESQWRHEQYSLIYFDNEKWYKPLDKAEQYDWKGAMELWFPLLSTNDPMRRSCAEYNIAVCCYMLGDYQLAAEWLDRSDKDNKLPLSDGLRKRIDGRK